MLGELVSVRLCYTGAGRVKQCVALLHWCWESEAVCGYVTLVLGELVSVRLCYTGAGRVKQCVAMLHWCWES